MTDKRPPSPTLSFIIPAFNAGDTLRDTLASVLAQTRTDWEAIIVDDGSTDNTAAIARSSTDPRVRVVSQCNRGLAGARNTGLRHACGEFVAFLDADDLVQPTFSERMLAAINDADAVACWYEFVGAGCESLAWIHRTSASDLSWPRLIQSNPLAVTVVVRRASLTRLLGRVDAFDESLRVLEDWDVWLRLAQCGVTWANVVEECLVRVRLRPGSLSQSVQHMYHTGLGVIAHHARDAREREDAIRHWNLLHLARFIACGDNRHAGLFSHSLSPILTGEFPLLASMCLSAMQRANLCGPSEAGRLRQAWVSSLLRAAPPELVPPLQDALSGLPSDWHRAGIEFAITLHSCEIPVIFGVGRNGQDALTGACEVSDRVCWIDDRPDAGVPRALDHRCTRLTREELTARHVVLVTPSDSSDISRDLRARGVRVHAVVGHRVAA